MYKIIRKFLFLFDPESVHYFSMKSLRLLCRIPFARKIVVANFSPADPGFSLERKYFGLTFRNPVGLGAGFDKNAKYLNELDALGFGFVEIGTVTPKPQRGNDKPRLFRLEKEKALINRMGFNNDGAETIAERLKRRNAGKDKLLSAKPLNPSTPKLIIGCNIGKNKTTPNEDAWKDYDTCFKTLYPYADYFVVNVSSPNTPGLRELQEKESLRKILTHLQEINLSMAGAQLSVISDQRAKPILLKIAPDLIPQQLDDVIDLALEIKLDGIVATNTTIYRDSLSTDQNKLETIGAGGLSGLPLRKRSTEVAQYIFDKTNGRVPVIASGGIFSAADALEKMRAGASLLQVWTGFIYEGPGIVRQLCKGL